jgi:hypothetical protein
MTSLPERRLHDDVSPPSTSSQKRTKSDRPEDGVDHESLDVAIAPALNLLRDNPSLQTQGVTRELEYLGLLVKVAEAYPLCDLKYNTQNPHELLQNLAMKLEKTDEMKEHLQEAIETGRFWKVRGMSFILIHDKSNCLPYHRIAQKKLFYAISMFVLQFRPRQCRLTVI